MPQQESLQFSINGDFITKLALEQLYKCNNLPYAIELLRACIKSESMTEAETLQTIINILNGKAAITGVYPTESYRIIPATPKKGQREFLFNYYTDRHKPDLARQYFNED